MNEITAARNINTITAEIHLIQAEVNAYMSQGALRIGERLCEAKELLAHGEFGEWIKAEFGWTDRTAQKLMSVYREFGATQKSLFGPDLNANTYSDLSFSKLYLLISVPESEREAFVEENNVSEISVREMQKLIAERDEARKAKQDAEARLEQAARTAADSAAMEKELRSKLKDAKEALNDAEKDLDREKEKATAGERELRDRIKELENRPVATVIERDEKAISEAVSAAKAEAEKELEKLRRKVKTAEDKAADAADKLKKADELTKQAAESASAEAKKEAEELKARLSAAESRLKTADPEIAVFTEKFREAQKLFTELCERVAGIGERDEATGDKLRRAMVAMLKMCGEKCGTRLSTEEEK